MKPSLSIFDYKLISIDSNQTSDHNGWLSRGCSKNSCSKWRSLISTQFDDLITSSCYLCSHNDSCNFYHALYDKPISDFMESLHRNNNVSVTEVTTSETSEDTIGNNVNDDKQFTFKCLIILSAIVSTLILIIVLFLVLKKYFSSRIFSK